METIKILENFKFLKISGGWKLQRVFWNNPQFCKVLEKLDLEFELKNCTDYAYKCNYPFFYLRFLSRTFTIHRTPGKGRRESL